MHHEVVGYKKTDDKRLFLNNKVISDYIAAGASGAASSAGASVASGAASVAGAAIASSPAGAAAAAAVSSPSNRYAIVYMVSNK
jgi:hypothetical protein